MLVGNGKLDQVFVANDTAMAMLDTDMPNIGISYNARHVAGESPSVRSHAATVTYVISGGTLVATVIIKRRDNSGTALSDTTYTLTGAAAYVALSGVAGSHSTIKELIDLLNDIPGITAWIMHAPLHQSTNCNDYVAAAAAEIPSSHIVDRSSAASLYRDGDQWDYAYMRIGLPEPRDHDAIDLIGIEGTCTGITAGALRVYQDNTYDYTGSARTAYLVNKPLVEAQTAYVDSDKSKADTFAGSLILEAYASDLTATSIRAHIRQASIG